MCYSPEMNYDNKYCSVCGSVLMSKQIDGKVRPLCVSCGRVVYFDPKLATTVVLVENNQVLMVRRLTHPGIGLWSLPGGYVDRGEVLEHAAKREVFEETGLYVEITGLIDLLSVEDDPIVLAAYDSYLIGGTLACGPEVSEAYFFPIGSLPDLAFPRDEGILRDWGKYRAAQ